MAFPHPHITVCNIFIYWSNNNPRLLRHHQPTYTSLTLGAAESHDGNRWEMGRRRKRRSKRRNARCERSGVCTVDSLMKQGRGGYCWVSRKNWNQARINPIPIATLVSILPILLMDWPVPAGSAQMKQSEPIRTSILVKCKREYS